MRHCTAAKSNNEKALRVMQTLRALAVVRRSQKISPRRRLPSEGVGRPKFNQLEMVTTFTYRSSLVRIDALHAISSYRGNRPTNTHTQKQTHRQDRLQYTAPLSLARSVIMQYVVYNVCLLSMIHTLNHSGFCIIVRALP